MENRNGNPPGKPARGRLTFSNMGGCQHVTYTSHCVAETNVSRIEKFYYLQSKVTGEAKSAISGLSLSHENYDVAIDTIQERFGDTQSVVNKHYMELINIQPMTNDILRL